MNRMHKWLSVLLIAIISSWHPQADAMVRPLPSVSSDSTGIGGLLAYRDSNTVARQVFTDIRGNVFLAMDAEWIDYHSRYSAFNMVGETSEFLNGPTYMTRRRDETGLVYMGARYFDPVAGRFISPDPGRFTDSRNLYALCGHNPITGRDPDGRLMAGAGRGALKGDYAQYGNRSQAVGGFVGQVGVGFTPAGVAGDVRDFTAAVGDLNDNGLGWRTGLGVGLSAVAFVPGVGDAIKGVFKPVLRVAEDIPVNVINRAERQVEVDSYEAIGGHHPRQQAARSNNPNYDPEAAITVEGLDHAEMTKTQLQINSMARKLGIEYTQGMEDAIARDVLRNGGATDAQIVAILEREAAELSRQGARAPTRTPGTRRGN